MLLFESSGYCSSSLLIISMNNFNLLYKNKTTNSNSSLILIHYQRINSALRSYFIDWQVDFGREQQQISVYSLSLYYFYSIMEIPLGNFFQVTVNSNKFSSFVGDIQKQIRIQAQRIDELSKTMNCITTSLSSKLKKSEQTLDFELQKMKRMNQEESNYLRLFLKDADKKAFQKIDEFQNALVIFNNRMNHIRQTIQDDVSLKVSFLEKKLMSTLPIEEVEKGLKKEMADLKISYANLESRLNQKCQGLSDEADKHNNVVKQKFSLGEFDGRREMSQKCISIRTPCRSQSRKRLKSHRNATLYENQDDINNIVSKISQLENRLLQEKEVNILSNNRIVKINENITNVTKSNININQKKIKQPSDLETVISAKLSKIEEIVTNKLSQCQKNYLKVVNRNQIIDQQMGIMTRKYEKERTRINEIITNFKKIDEKRNDERVIEGLKNAIKKLNKEFEQCNQSKLNKEIFDKERTKILDRIHLLNDIIVEKAQKNEVKKGFTFFEEKIKEIIIVLAQQKNYNKDSATKKMPFKCLSCDKELEYNNLEQNQAFQRYLRDSTTSSARCSTTQLRKRIRVINNSSVGNDD